MIYGFTGIDARNLAAVHVPASAFENSALYNVLDDAAEIRARLDALPQDQYFHPYVAAGTPAMTNSCCKRALVMPMQWNSDLAREYPDGIGLKKFHDRFLAPIALADRPALNDAFTWWRHAASRSAGAPARVRSGLQVATSQALTPAIRARREAWAQAEVEQTLAPLRAQPPPLSNATFEAAITQLRTDITMQHNAREVREQAQHANHEAREDHRDAQQTFEGWYRVPKLEEVLRLLDLQSKDDLPETLRDLAKNKKKSEDTWVLQNAIDA